MSQEITNIITEIKIIIIGKSGSGKTSYVNRWIKNTFNETYKSTIVSEFSHKTYIFKNKTYKINLWDLAGQDHFNSLIKAFCKEAKGCITMADILLPSSLNDALNWKKTLDENETLADGSNIPNILILNKYDLISSEKKDFNVIEEFVKKNKFDAWFKTSAKTGENIKESMDTLLEIVINKLKDINDCDSSRFKNSLALEPRKCSGIDILRNKQSGCC